MEDAFKLGTDNLLFYVAGSGVFFMGVCQCSGMVQWDL